MGRKRRDLMKSKPNAAVRPAEYYAERQQAYANGGRPKRPYGQGTLRSTKIMERAWSEYCQFRGWDTVTQLATGVPGIYISFFDWYCDQYAVSRVTIRNYWQSLCRMYRLQTDSGMPKATLHEIGEAISAKGSLTKDHQLSVMPKEKPVISVDDFWDMLSCLWQTDDCPFIIERMRVQFHLYELIAAYTGSRPGALLSLHYKDCKLSLLPDLEPHGRPIFVLEITFRHTKNDKGASSPNTFLFHSNPHLALCPVTFFIATAFADGAFAAPDLKTPAQIYSLEIEEGLQQMFIPWKESINDTAVFRAAGYSCSGWQLSTNPLSHRILCRFKGNASKAARWEESLTTYSLRRATANAVSNLTTTALRNQIMGHENARTYEKYYANLRIQCDVQNAFLGIPSNDRLLAVASRVGRSTDPRRPVAFEEGWWEEIFQESSSLRDLNDAKVALRASCISLFGSMWQAADAEHQGSPNEDLQKAGQAAIRALTDDALVGHDPPGTYAPYQGLHARYEDTRRRLKNLRHCLRREWTEKKQRDFNKSTPIDDIQRQLNGLPSTVSLESNVSMCTTSRRSNLATQLFCKDFNVVETSLDVARRVRALTDLIAYCGIQEPRSTARKVVKTNNSRCKTKELISDGSSVNGKEDHSQIDINDTKGDWQATHSLENHAHLSESSTPMILGPTTCLHCLFNPSYVSYRWEKSRLCRKDALQRHAKSKHFAFITDDEPVLCPHELCVDQRFDDLDHFKNHALAVHRIAY
ncbi:hypothetical protein GJ744_001268 [Endocarpon pusillum]|uniref:C2H2-type domain-containing protein n=1 Tax=Endocarpon pusillum TaxID=364733 RepID=A0A8H7ABP5_9EURO|nr:hypothetical protein GJ744_001268 [Endocarpon pusillum]